MMKFTRLILISVGVNALRLGAQVAGPSPLVEAQAVAATVPGGLIAAELQANAALQAGFARTAVAIYQEILLDPSLSNEARHRIVLGRVTAWLAAGDLAEAEKSLQSYTGPRNSDYQLRVGLIAVGGRRIPQVKAALAAGKVEELPPVDRGWWYFLQAVVAIAENDLARRNKAYEEASKAAVSELQRARFLLAEEQALMRMGQLNEAQLKVLKDNMERFQGQSIGYEYLKSYAAALAGMGRGSEAQAMLKSQLAVMPLVERNVIDQLRLTLGLIAGDESVAGQQAFRQLLKEGQKPETQRLALQLLAHGAKLPADREQLRRDLTELIVAPTRHPILEDLYLVRAQAALADKRYAPADEDALTLLERYPGSALKPAALGVRLAVAWNWNRYITAADVIAKLREGMAAGRERAELGVMLAEAFFRAEDFKNAAYAYAAALKEQPLAVPAGILIFQRVLADIRADQLESAVEQLDSAATDPAFDVVNRWQAEWNLMKEMQVRGQTQAAYVRANGLLEGGGDGVPDDLRIRLMWLRAKFSFDNGKPDVTLRQTDELLAFLQTGGLREPSLRAEVTSTTQLLRAQALLKLDREEDGLAGLIKLRADFRGAKAAEYSYLVHADHLTQKGDMAGAQAVLISFVDSKDYKDSEYAALALYEAALSLERQGLLRQLSEAYELLERLNKSYPQNDLVFYSRLKQGDILRNLNDFATARQVYEYLIVNYTQHPDVLLAQLALADTLFAQGANPVNLEGAATMFERLRDLPSAPLDLRVEAGTKWGLALVKRSQAAVLPFERDQQNAKAQTVLWSVVQSFLLEEGQGAKLGAKGRWWLSRNLLELGQIHEDAGNLDEAQRAYRLIVDYKLGGRAQAEDKLARYRPVGVVKP